MVFCWVPTRVPTEIYKNRLLSQSFSKRYWPFWWFRVKISKTNQIVRIEKSTMFFVKTDQNIGKKWCIFLGYWQIKFPCCVGVKWMRINVRYWLSDIKKLSCFGSRRSQVRILLPRLENQPLTMYFVGGFFVRVPTRVPTWAYKIRWLSQSFAKKD